MKQEPEILVTNPVLDKDGVTLKIPSNLCKYLGIKKNTKELFVIPTNGVLQLSSGKPITVIPALTEMNSDFELQTNLLVKDDEDGDNDEELD